jgi:hypothetical protein
MSNDSISSNSIQLTSKRAKRAASNIHLIAGAGIFFTGLSNLDFPDHKTLAIAEMAVGGLLLLGLLLEKVLPHAHVERFDWILDVLAAGVAFVEGVSKMHGGVRPIVVTYWFVAAMFIALAILRPRLKKLRYARLEKESLVLKTHPFKREQTIAWNDIASCDVNGNLLIMTKAGTSYKIRLDDQEEPDDVKNNFLEQLSKRGIQPTPTPIKKEVTKKEKS